MKLTPATLLIVAEKEKRALICNHLDQYYWSDNGGDTDGPSYLIEADDLKDFDGIPKIKIEGTRLDGYKESHANVLNVLGFPWTGWQDQAYALIAAQEDSVRRALHNAEEACERMMS